ncbi:MAG: dephospho-CoA kinase [Lutibacter sp.]|uniref:dephospho-CoA kinase n=1 Tax=Lutibacter sp. TaxID=1925666 RepID=UPI0017DCB980|nr:dephospho-CoA kinase [Lutibacter sp.]MBT8317039.1 dephospho-CoA kinase [Lutibacter sp.]NNJ57899.1 dephospho-CoA kinase [Lutibacter sp.]
MKIIGLTGGIGSGKTTVLKMFQKLGAEVYIADIEAKKLMNSDLELIQQIQQIFGENAYVNQTLNRQYIAEVVFNDKEKLLRLNRIVHPKVREHFKEFIHNSKAKIVLYESAILFESGSDSLCNFLITVIANLDDRIQRIMLRDKTTEKQIKNRIKNQLADDYKIKKAHFVVNNQTVEDTKLQVDTIYDLIKTAS